MTAWRSGPSTRSRHGRTGRRAARGVVVLATAVLLAIAGCGAAGSGDIAGVGTTGTGPGPFPIPAPNPPPPPSADGSTGTGGTGSPVVPTDIDDADVPRVAKTLVSGVVTLGSGGGVIVAGVELDIAAATVIDGDGVPSTPQAVAEGQVLEVEATVDADTGRGVASEVRVVTEVRGAVDAIDPANGRLTVLDTPVQVSSETRWSPGASLSGLTVGSVVEVYGFRDEAGVVAASRIEVPSSPARTGSVVLRGEVTSIGAAGRAISVAGLRVSLRGFGALPDGVGVGTRVRVIGTRAGPGTPLVATSIERLEPAFNQNEARATLTGRITRVRSLADLRVGGYPVDASAATWVGNARVALEGRRTVVATGVVRDGRLVARRIRLAGADPAAAQPEPFR